MKSIYYLIVLTVLFSCTKKKDDPKPQVQSTVQQSPNQLTANKKLTERQGNPMIDGYIIVTVTGSSSGTDSYKIVAYSNSNVILSTTNAKVWFESGVPKSDVLVFIDASDYGTKDKWRYTYSYLTGSSGKSYYMIY